MARTQRRVLRAALPAYALLLGVSFFVRIAMPAASHDARGHWVEVGAVARGRVLADRVAIAYDEYASGAASSAEALVLLHGSPGHKEDFARLAPILARDARVIVPDLPGFGASTTSIPDYSIGAHATYVRQLMDALVLRRAHLVALSMGGGVALNFSAATPERLASITMLSAVGVQEMELTGSYPLNRVVHGLQLGALWLLREGTPHMGRLDRSMLGVSYARNFFDSDQRPLREALRRVAAPMLIVHGIDDGAVPIEAAREHHRLVPQSELVTFDGGHFIAFARTGEVGEVIRGFVARAAAGGAATRADATPERARAAEIPFDTSRLPRLRGIGAVVAASLLSVGSLASPSAAGLAAGALVARRRVSVLTAVGGCALGVLLGAIWASIRRRPRHDAGRPGRWPAARPLASAALLLVASAAMGTALLRSGLVASMGPVPQTTLIALSGGLGLAAVTAASSTKRRRLLLSAWRRWTRWEFWPPWVFYPPVLAYVAGLMIRHRSPTLFTAANPAILAGGFVGESKYDILRSLAGAGEYVARASLIPGGERQAEKIRIAERFMHDEGLTFPIVLKPNHGQRGSGVVVVRSAEQLAACLSQSPVDTIVQEYVDGPEFGVFYVRRPSETQGRIFSITEKRFPTVVGDGRRTLEALILDDDRAVCAAPVYLERFRAGLRRVPADGERVPLAELGTHCRGALFMDGGSLLTPALEARFDRMARGFEGFYFGRFDVRAQAGVDAFRRGFGFKVIELNGVTSEATHIYHPGTPLLAAYRVLLEQWRLAFEIGAENRRRGVAPTSLRTLVRLTRDYSRTARGHLHEHAGAPAPAIVTSLQRF